MKLWRSILFVALTTFAHGGETYKFPPLPVDPLPDLNSFTKEHPLLSDGLATLEEQSKLWATLGADQLRKVDTLVPAGYQTLTPFLQSVLFNPSPKTDALVTATLAKLVRTSNRQNLQKVSDALDQLAHYFIRRVQRDQRAQFNRLRKWEESDLTTYRLEQTLAKATLIGREVIKDRIDELITAEDHAFLAEYLSGKGFVPQAPSVTVRVAIAVHPQKIRTSGLTSVKTTLMKASSTNTMTTTKLPSN